MHHNFKLIRYNVNGQPFVQLFDLNTDPLEMHNLAEETRHRVKLTFMDSLLNRTMKEMNDFCDIHKPGWGYPKKWTMSDVKKLNP
ncbi:hypothetical protein [Agriterribacter sp.]|uniref:hypothetical protein n=1 Tax=Agriterribacter sp. TaxID=2821509 RepID=UPI002C9D0F2A|nr:hypothetical protein [Agriterribacter sp.]HRP55434.1 hypothetical protein [Agriterribacter sp.]